jgi:glycolate oxidase FAD binding subunit
MTADADIAQSIAEGVRLAHAERRALRIVGGDTKAWYGRPVHGDSLEMAAHRGVIDYEPSELVITARAGTPVAEIKALLAANRQTLGFEPPIFGPASTIGGVVAAGLAGPARPFSGAVRDHMLGVQIIDGRGRTLRFGGTVFKNVAGFDAFRLMCGAMGTLGVILDVSLRVSPAPAERRTLAVPADWPRAQGALTEILSKPYPIDGAFHQGDTLTLRVSGPSDGVRETLAALGGREADPLIWRSLRDFELPVFGERRLWRLSVPRTAHLPVSLAPSLHDWAGGLRWVAGDAPAEMMRQAAAAVGGHATLFRGASEYDDVFAPLPPALLSLHRRIKAVFDPAGILNPGRLYEGL